jgi:hypothetical protein
MKQILAQQASVNKPENSVINPITREISQAKVDSNLNRGDDKLAKSIVDKTGDGLNSNVIKLSDHITKLNKTIQTSIKASAKMSEQQVGDVTGNAMGKRQFNTLRPRVEGIKENVKDFFTMRGFLDKTGIAKRGSGGIVSEYLDRGEAKNKYIDQRMKTKGTTFGSKETFARQFDEQKRIESEINKNEKQIKELQASGATDVGLKRGGFLKKREELATQYAKVAPDARPTAESKSEDKDTGKVLPFKKTTAETAGSEEAMLEQNKMVAEQTELLIKIEENTRGDGKGKPKTKAGAAGEAQGGGGGGMGLMDMLGLTGLGGRVLGGVKTAGRFLGGAALTGAKFIGRNPLLMAGTAVAAGAYTGYKGYQAAGEREDAENKRTEADLAAGKITQEQADERKLKSGESSTVGKSKSVGKGTGMAVGGAAGALKGAALGAALGSVVPVVGTAIGGLLGGAIGGIGGSYLGGKAGDYLGEKTGQAINYVGKAKNSVLGMFGKGDKVVDNGDGSKSTFKSDGSKIVQDASGTKTFDTSGKLISQTAAVTATVAAAPVAPVSATSKAEKAKIEAEKTRMVARDLYQSGTKDSEAARQKLDEFKKANPFDIKPTGDIESGMTPGKFTDPKKQKEYQALLDTSYQASDKKDKAKKDYQTADNTGEYKFNKAGQEVRNIGSDFAKLDALINRFGYKESDFLREDGKTLNSSKINQEYDKRIKEDLLSKNSPAPNAAAPAAKDANISQGQGQPLKSGPQGISPAAKDANIAQGQPLKSPTAPVLVSDEKTRLASREMYQAGTKEEEAAKQKLKEFEKANPFDYRDKQTTTQAFLEVPGTGKFSDPKKQKEYDALQDAKYKAADKKEKAKLDYETSDNAQEYNINKQGQQKENLGAIFAKKDVLLSRFGYKESDLLNADGKSYSISKINTAYDKNVEKDLTSPAAKDANISQGQGQPLKSGPQGIGANQPVADANIAQGQGQPLKSGPQGIGANQPVADANIAQGGKPPVLATPKAGGSMIAGEPWSAGQELSNNQLAEISAGIASGKTYSNRVINQYHTQSGDVKAKASLKVTAGPQSGIDGDVLSKKSTANEQAKMEAAKSSSGNNTSVIAPTVNNTSNQTQLIKPQIRNQESSQTRYQDSRYAF